MGNIPSLLSNCNCCKGKTIQSKITIQIESNYKKGFQSTSTKLLTKVQSSTVTTKGNLTRNDNPHLSPIISTKKDYLSLNKSTSSRNRKKTDTREQRRHSQTFIARTRLYNIQHQMLQN